MRVMIVDDNARVRAILRAILRNSAEDIYECDDGSGSLASYMVLRPDWVVMDIKMKLMDGIQATKDILASFPDAKIIMITQYNDQRLRQMALQAGARACILKENLLDVDQIIRQSAKAVSTQKHSSDLATHRNKRRHPNH